MDHDFGGIDHSHIHEIVFPDHHAGGPEDEDEPEELASLAWRIDNVELLTVGVDVGSSTSHLLFARLHLQRLAQTLSSRFAVVKREVLHRSPVLLTPYRPDGLIDVDELERFIARSYKEAGLKPEQVDTGAVILTGAALERANARAVADLFAREGGKFVCASAGHNLEAILAAHGSGASSPWCPMGTSSRPLPCTSAAVWWPWTSRSVWCASSPRPSLLAVRPAWTSSWASR